jgi:hypothetical protein
VFCQWNTLVRFCSLTRDTGGVETGPQAKWRRPDLRLGPRRFRGNVGGLSIQANGGRFAGRRDQRDWTERKYAMWETGEKMPSQKPNSLMRCPCGETFDSHLLEHTVIHVPHITKANQADEIRR